MGRRCDEREIRICINNRMEGEEGMVRWREKEKGKTGVGRGRGGGRRKQWPSRY